MTFSMSTYNKEFLTEVFEIYKSHSCLWKFKSPEYHNKLIKKQAYADLVNKFKEVDPDANEDFVRKKITNYRTCYKREQKLMQQSLLYETEYTPKLWYFNILSFIDEEDINGLSLSNIKTENEYETLSNSSASIPVTSIEVDPLEDSAKSTFNSPKNDVWRRNKIKRKIQFTNRKPTSNPVSRRDRFDIAGENVACKLRSLANNQRIFAEKLINDVLFEAECDNLDRNSSIVVPSPTNNSECNQISIIQHNIKSEEK